jgi:hypothetical protein
MAKFSVPRVGRAPEVVMVEWGRPDFLDKLRVRLGSISGNDIVIGAFDRLTERKRRGHAADHGAVGNWELRLEGDGSIALWAEARG